MAILLDQRIQGLYAITPNKKVDFTHIERVLSMHQVTILQYRHKTDNKQLKYDEATRLCELCHTHHTLFIINDDINLCEKVAADGVHLGQDDASIEVARALLGEESIIGVSCYNQLNLAIKAENEGANYVAFGALFDSKTKPHAKHCPLSVIEQARDALQLPIVGIGGITFDNQQLAFDAGCDAVAMVDALCT